MASIQLVSGETVLVDDEDLAVVGQFDWSMKTGRRYNGHIWSYPGTGVLVNKKARFLYLHRLVMGAKWGDGSTIDHKNGNVLDARKLNLRFCSHGQNICNQRAKTKSANKSSRFHGVYAKRKGWIAQIRCNKKKYELGYFKDERQAAEAYDMAAKELHGEYAALNFS